MLMACGYFFVPALCFEIELDFGDSAAPGNPIPSILLRVTDQAYGYNLKGLEALDRGTFDEALEYFRSALELLPSYRDAENNMGVAYFRSGNVSRARDIWQGLVRKDSGYATAWYNLGIISYHEKDVGAAIGHFETALKNNRNFFQALVMLGKIRLESGDKRGALRDLKKAYEINPSDRTGWAMYAFALIQSGDTSRAQAVLLEHRADPHALEILGKIDALRGNASGAKKYLAEAAAAGGDASVLLDLAAVMSESAPCAEVLQTLDSYFSRENQPAADAWILAGVEAKECGDIARARQFFQQGLAMYPGDPIIRFNLGQMYFYEKDYDRALAIWQLLGDTLSDPLLFHVQALAAHHKKDLASAERLIRKAIALDGRKAEYYDFLGVILHEKGARADAMKYFKKALEINPALQSAQMHFAASVKSGNEMRKAIEQARARIAACDTGCAEARLAAAILYYHAGEITQAAAVLEKIPDNERDERTLRHQALFYRLLHEWDRAINCLETARKNFVVEPQTEYDLVECYLQAGLYQQATALLSQLVPKRPDDAWRLYYQLGYACIEQNRLDEAERYLQKSMALKKDYTPSQGLLAFVYNRQGRLGEARTLWEKTLDADPSNHVLWINMGLAFESEGKYDTALEKYAKAASLNPADQSIQINIGNACAAMGRYAEALAAYRKALQSHKRESAAYNAFVTACRLDDTATARDMMHILAREYPASENTLRARAELLGIEGNAEKALRLFEGLKEKNEHDWFAMARLYFSRGEMEMGEEALRRLPADAAWNAAAIQLRAETAYADKQYQRALELWRLLPDTSFFVRYNIALTALHCKDFSRAFETAQALAHGARREEAADVYRIAAGAALGLQRWEEAEQWYRRLMQLNGSDAAAMYNLAVALFNRGKTDEAWNWYTRAVGIDLKLRDAAFERRFAPPSTAATTGKESLDSLDEMYNAAVAMQTAGGDSAAELLYLKIIAVNPGYSRACNNLGAIYAARGQLRDAEKYYKQAIEKEHGFVEAYANLVGVYIAQRDFRQARRWLQKGMMHNPDNELLMQTKNSLKAAMGESP